VTRWTGWCALCAVLCAGTSARGQDGADAVVLLSPAGQEVTPFVQALQGQLAEVEGILFVQEIPVLPASLADRLEMARKAAAHFDARAAFWTDEDEAGNEFLFLTTPTGERILVRALGNGQEPAFEAAAIIVRSALEALAEGGEIGVSTGEMVTPVSPPATMPPPPAETVQEEPGVTPFPVDRPLRMVLRGTFSMAAVSERHPVLAGGMVFAGVRRRWLSAGIGAAVSASRTESAAGLQVEVRRIPLCAAALAHGEVGRWRLGGALDLCADLNAVNARALNDAARALPDRVRPGLSARLRFDAVATLSRSVGLFVGAGLDIPILKNRYLFEINNENVEILKIWPVIPHVLLGLEFLFF